MNYGTFLKYRRASGSVTQEKLRSCVWQPQKFVMCVLSFADWSWVLIIHCQTMTLKWENLVKVMGGKPALTFRFSLSCSDGNSKPFRTIVAAVNCNEMQFATLPKFIFDTCIRLIHFLELFLYQLENSLVLDIAQQVEWIK